MNILDDILCYKIKLFYKLILQIENYIYTINLFISIAQNYK
jgi:hypothetical protein